MSIPYLPRIVSEALVKRAAAPREPDGLIHASSLGPRDKVCPRRLQFEYLAAPAGPRPKVPLELAWSLARGTILHAWLEPVLRTSDLQLEMEVPVDGLDPDLPLGGTMDALIRYYDGDKPEAIGAEFKSVTPEGFTFLKAPFRTHVYQSHVYMILSGVRRFIFVYFPHAIDKRLDEIDLLRKAGKLAQGNLQEKIEALLESLGPLAKRQPFELREVGKQFVVDFDPETAADIKAQVREVLEASLAGEFLKRNTTHCELCPFQAPCFDKEATVQSVNRRHLLKVLP